MLRDKDALATIAVRELSMAAAFYEGVLGLEREELPEQGVAAFKSGRSRILVYESQFAGTNQATAATFIVGNELAQIVEKLKARGAKFERYDFPATRHEGEIHVSGTTRVAWLKDPDGNILSLVNG